MCLRGKLTDAEMREFISGTLSTPCEGVFPIVAASPFPDTINIKPSDVDNLTECHFNVGIQTTSVWSFRNILRRLEGTSFKLILG